MQDAVWLSEKVLLTCIGRENGPSRFQIYNINMSNDSGRQPFEFTLQDDSVVSKDAVREVAVNEVESNWCAYGGYDQTLNLIDFNHDPRTVASVNLDADIGSIKWSRFTSNRCLSLTRDEGVYMMFDACADPNRPVFEYRTDRKFRELYTHERIDDHIVVLGFESGCLQVIDIRNPSMP